MEAAQLHEEPLRGEHRFRDLFFLALSMGAFTGFLEGAGLYAFQAGRWAGWGFFGTTAKLPVLYLSPLFALLIFAGVALLLQLLLSVFRVSAIARLGVVFGVLVLLAIFDWLALAEGLATYSKLILALGLACAAERWFRRRWPRVLDLSPRLFAASAAYLCVVALGVSLIDWQREKAARAVLPSPRPGAPNILLVILDTVRADHLSAHGYARKTSPFLESLAAGGTTFDDAVAPSSWTFPSHVSILTGRYPREHGAVLNGYDGRYPTVASSFDQLGYLTAGFSGNMDWFASGRGMTSGFQHFEDGFWSVGSIFSQTGYGHLIHDWIASATGNRLVLGYKRARDVNRTALRWLDAAPKRPFFLVLNYYDANAGGALPQKPYRDMFSTVPLPPPARSSQESLPAEIDRARSNEYDGALAYMDLCIREFLEALRQRGLSENLVVVVTSDHGDLLGEHGMLGHRNTLYWDLIRVPLIFSGIPGQPRGLRIERPVSLVSLPATLLEIAGQSEASGFPAPSLTRLWKTPGDAASWPFPIAELAQMPFPGLESNPNYSGSLSAIVTPRWLLIDHSVDGPALFDWLHDPENLHDLIATSGGKALSAALTGCLQARNVDLRGAECRIEGRDRPETQGSVGQFGASGEQ